MRWRLRVKGTTCKVWYPDKVKTTVRISNDIRTDDYYVETFESPGKHGVYKSLGMAKKIARGIIEHNLKWNLTGKSCSQMIIDDVLPAPIKEVKG